MRAVIAVLALGLAACSDAIDSKTGETGAAAPEGYTMIVRATAQEQSYLVIAPDGRTVGARSAEAASALMDADRAQALAAEPPPRMEDVPEVLSLRVPGFNMSIGGTSDDADGDGDNDQGQVKLSVGGERGQRVEVAADEGGPGEADDRAFVRITGADEEAVRDFINDADDLSPEVRQQMLTGLGLQ